MPFILRRDDYEPRRCGSYEQFDPEKPELEAEFFRPVMFGQPLSAKGLAMLPDPYRIGGLKGKEVADVFGDSLGPWHVSDRVKAIIEELEPGLHNFIPINAIKLLKGGKEEAITPPGRTFFILHTQRVVKAVLVDETDFEGGGDTTSRGAVWNR